ncbi:hypothetical protein [Microbacterium abyssi]|uniref:hypothetical protein n=1 Tax=Microbacterium abyssi TaxID=2782166 RepID=UPI0018893C66|nr:hypothetical protein [Microbacterium sp. A18JL241]
MSDSRRHNDRIRTGPAIPGPLLHALLPTTAALAALMLVPILGWQLAVVGTALLGTLFPQTLGGWLSIACLAVGMLLGTPTIWSASAAVLLVHLMQVLSSLLPVVPWRGRVLVRALGPTIRRLLGVQLIAQPITLIMMLVRESDGVAVHGAAIVGAAAVAGFACLFLLRLAGRSRRP